MNKLSFLGVALLVTIFASCGSKDKESDAKDSTQQVETADAKEDGNQTKTIEPVSTDFQYGQVARYVEVESQPVTLTLIQDEYAGMPRQIWRAEVPLKLIKAGYEGVDPRDINLTRLMSVAIIEILDSNGTTLFDLDIKDSLSLKKLLTKSEGTVETIVFEKETYNSEKTPQWFNDAKSFKPGGTADIEVVESN